MAEHLHHTHLFTNDLDATVTWWQKILGGEVIYDGDFGGARNVFMEQDAYTFMNKIHVMTEKEPYTI